MHSYAKASGTKTQCHFHSTMEPCGVVRPAPPLPTPSKCWPPGDLPKGHPNSGMGETDMGQPHSQEAVGHIVHSLGAFSILTYFPGILCIKLLWGWILLNEPGYGILFGGN